jgi:hypothetical protein
MIEADGLRFVASTATSGTLTFTFYKTFMIPFNVLNQIFDTGNLFYISLLKNQMMSLTLNIVPYSMARIFGTETLFDTNLTGIVDTDLVINTKESEKVKSDVERGDNVVKFF